MARSISCTFFIVFFTIRCSNSENQVPKDHILAQVEDKTITVQEFIRRAEYSIRPDYCKQSNYVHKKIVLNSLLAEKMTALEMSKTNDKLLTSSNFLAFIKGRKEQSMRQIFYNDHFFKNVEIADTTIQKHFITSGRVIEINYINLPDMGTTNKVQELLNQEISLSSIYKTIWGSEISLKHISWFDREPESIHNQVFSNEIEKGQIIGPFQTEDETFLIIEIVGWTDSPVITQKDQKSRWGDIKKKLAENIAKKEYLKHIESLMKGKKFQLNQKVFDRYAFLTSEYYLKKNESKKQAMNLALWEDIERPNKIDFDKNIAISLEEVLFNYDGKNWTVQEFNTLIQSHPLVFRKRKIKNSDFRNQLRFAIADLLRDKIITEKCYEENLDKDWRVLADVNLWHDAYASKRYASLIQQDVSSNENNPSSLINNIVDSLQVQYSERTKINMNIFERIQLTSTDMVVTKRGLPYPIMVPIFPILTTDDRIDYGSTMK